MKRTNYGFTLIELLIVVAIIAILAAIAVPNFLEAQVRAKISRVQSDQRSLATAIESYMVDNNTYIPSAYASPTFTNPPGANPAVWTFRALGLLTSPVAFITAIPADVFGTKTVKNTESTGWQWGGKDPFFFWSGNAADPGQASDPASRRSIWVLESVGPDQALNIGVSALPSAKPYNTDPAAASVMLRGGQTADPAGVGSGTPAWGGLTYDATNGTNSAGDIFKFNSSATLPTLVRGI